MRAETSPTARALLALELVQNTPGITADRLADRLGVTSRAARRYIAILREAGIPISSVSGPAGGYRVGRGLRLPPLMFSQAEALGLVMAVLDGHHDPADPTDTVGTALGKILRALPEAVAAEADAVRRTASPVPDRAAARPDPEITADLVRACAEFRAVRLRYRSEHGPERDIDVDPWAVVVRHSRWYLLCRSHPADAIRSYRIDRTSNVQTLTATFRPPSDLDPARLLETNLGSGWDYGVEVTISADRDRCTRLLPGILGTLTPIDSQTTRLTGTTSDPYWYAEQLAVIPWPYRVHGGPEIRSTARALAERMLAALTDDAC